MRRKKIFFDRKKIYIILGILLIFVVSLTLVYASLSVTLNIVGQASLESNWDIRFQNPVVKEGSATTDLPVITNNTTASFSTTLVEPGDFYEFTIEVYNAGNIDAIVDSVSKPLDLTDEQKKYINYDIKWSDGSSIEAKQALGRASLLYLVVRLEYRNDILASDLPSTSSNINLSFKLNYVQGNSYLITDNGTVGSTPVDPNTFVVAMGKKFSVVPGMSIYQGIRDGVAVENQTKSVTPYANYVSDAETVQYFLGDDLRALPLMTTIVEQGKTYESTSVYKTANVSSDDISSRRYNTVVVDIQSLYYGIDATYSESIYSPVFVDYDDTYLDVCHAVNVYAGLNPELYASKMEYEILLDFIVGYPAGQETGCAGRSDNHVFIAFLDENGNPILLDRDTEHLDISKTLSHAFASDTTTFEEAKQQVLDYIANM